VFPAVRLAREAGAIGGTAPAVFNAANEVAVDAFRAGDLTFTGIVDTVGAVVAAHTPVVGPDFTLEAVSAADAWARMRATELIAVGER